MSIIIANSNPVYDSLILACKDKYNAVLITERSQLTAELLSQHKVDYIFFPHWSSIIPEEIYKNYNCVVFHMTDLPYGRGGSPLQNLIVRGIETTKLSALKVEEGIDTGPIYLKKDLPLYGTAEEIFLRAGTIMIEMIEEIITNKPVPAPQQGEPVIFRRRKPADSNIQDITSLDKLYDHIRMLDAENYPNAFIETTHFRIEFSRASLKKNGIIADVRIIKK